MRVAPATRSEVVVEVTSGLPGGCARFDHYTVARSGASITIAVWNTMPTAAVACTAIYGIVRHSIALGSDFPAGRYTVRANDVTTNFTAP